MRSSTDFKRNNFLRLKKQRLTATVLFEELTKKGIYQGFQRRMQELVKAMRQQLSLVQPESFIPLEFIPGSSAQIVMGKSTAS